MISVSEQIISLEWMLTSTFVSSKERQGPEWQEHAKIEKDARIIRGSV